MIRFGVNKRLVSIPLELIASISTNTKRLLKMRINEIEIVEMMEKLLHYVTKKRKAFK